MDHNLIRRVYRTRAKISNAYSKLTRFLDKLIFEKNQEMLIFDQCLFKKNVKDVKEICKRKIDATQHIGVTGI